MVRRIAAHFLFTGWLFSLAAAIPAPRPSSLSLASVDVSQQSNDAHISPLNASQIIHYSIPQTQIVIVIYTGSPIRGPAMHNTLEACISAAHGAIVKHGDVYMFPDPYLFKTLPVLHAGLEIRAYSTMVPGLKWIDLSSMLVGIEQAMWQRAIYKEAHVKMFDGPSGLEMGVADLYRSPPADIAGIL